MLLGTLTVSVVGNILVGKGIIRSVEETILSRPGFLMPPYPLINFEIQKYYQNEPKFNGVYSRNNLPKIKHGAYLLTLDEYINRNSIR